MFKTKCAVRKKYTGSLGENGTTADFLSLLEKFFRLPRKLQGDHRLEGSLVELFSLMIFSMLLPATFLSHLLKTGKEQAADSM